MRTCSKCKIEKSFEEYSKDLTDKYKGGYKTICKSCTKEYRKKYYKERGKEVYYFWRKTPRGKVKTASQAMKRYASKKNGTPPWLTEEHRERIEEFYWLAKDIEAVTGEKYHVDHIVPLRGKEVCGLHVPWNLQVLPSDINVSKNNRLLT